MLYILLLVCVVGDGCHMDFDYLGYIQDDKIIVLQYSMLVLLILLVLCKSP